MRVPASWLREYVPLEMPLPELATKLSISSAEVTSRMPLPPPPAAALSSTG